MSFNRSPHIYFMKLLTSLKKYALLILSRCLLEECISPIFVPSVSIFIQFYSLKGPWWNMCF